MVWPGPSRTKLAPDGLHERRPVHHFPVGQVAVGEKYEIDVQIRDEPAGNSSSS